VGYARGHPDKLSPASNACTRQLHNSAFQILGLSKDMLIGALEQNYKLWWNKLVALVLHRMLGLDLALSIHKIIIR
jgi:hypothetical protein